MYIRSSSLLRCYLCRTFFVEWITIVDFLPLHKSYMPSLGKFGSPPDCIYSLFHSFSPLLQLFCFPYFDWQCALRSEERRPETPSCSTACIISFCLWMQVLYCPAFHIFAPFYLLVCRAACHCSPKMSEPSLQYDGPGTWQSCTQKWTEFLQPWYQKSEST